MRIVANTESPVRLAGLEAASNKPTDDNGVEIVSGGPYRKRQAVAALHQRIMDEAQQRAAAVLAQDESADLGIAFHAGLTPAAERWGYSTVACVVGRSGLQGFGCSTLFLSAAATANVRSGDDFSRAVLKAYERPAYGDIVEALAPGADPTVVYRAAAELAFADYQSQAQQAAVPRGWD